MPRPDSDSAVRRELIAFTVIAYALSWSVEIPLALQVRGGLSTDLPVAAHYLASFGPLAAAWIVTFRARGRTTARSPWTGLGRWRIGVGYALFIVGVPTGAFVLAALVERLRGAWPDLALLGRVDGLPHLGVVAALALWFLTFGLGEETGWRGFALPRLQSFTTAWRATVLVGAAWAGWHLPAFFYRDTYRAMGVAGFPMFLISIVGASVVFTWLFNATGGSLLAVTVFHALFDFFSVTPAGGAWTAPVMSATVLFWALFVARRYGPVDLAPTRRVAATPPRGPGDVVGR